MSEFFEGLGLDYEQTQVTTVEGGYKKLVAGGYIIKIEQAKSIRTDAQHVKIRLKFDIIEGEYAGHYKDRYAYEKQFDGTAGREPAKWKGTYDIFFPVKGTETYEKDLTSFKRAITALNDSNPSRPINPAQRFSVDAFVGLIVGGIFGEKEFNGNKYVSISWLRSADAVRKGDFKLPKPQGQKNNNLMQMPAQFGEPVQQVAANPNDFEAIIYDGEVPF